MRSLIRFASFFRDRSPYNWTPVLNLRGRVILRCCLAFVLPLFHASFAAVLMSFIFVICTDFNLCCTKDSSVNCSRAALFASSSAFSFPAMSRGRSHHRKPYL